MIPMKISVLYRNRFAFYKISNFPYYYIHDDEIAYFLNIEINEYRERLKKYNIVHYTGISNEIYLKPNIGRDRLIEIFKNEFAEELTLAKLENRKIDGIKFNKIYWLITNIYYNN